MFEKDSSLQYEQFKPIIVDIENDAQFIGAGSTEDYVAVYQFIDGAQLNRSDDSYVELVTNEQKERLNQTIVEATEAGLAFDSANPSGANAFYSSEKGFTLIDYSVAYWPLTYRENWSAALRSLGPVALQAFASS